MKIAIRRESKQLGSTQQEETGYMRVRILTISPQENLRRNLSQSLGILPEENYKLSETETEYNTGLKAAPLPLQSRQ